MFDGLKLSRGALCRIDYHSAPYISIINRDGVPGHGTFLCEHKGVYYGEATKMPTADKSIAIESTEQSTNKMFARRRTCAMQLSGPEAGDETAVAVHISRNMSITFASFVNLPYPLHVLQYHKKLLGEVTIDD